MCTATLLIGSPRPRGDGNPSAATLPALIGSPRPRAAEPQVRQPYQEHGIGYPCVAVFLYGHPFAIGLLTRGQAPGAATLSGDPYFMGLDTHTVFRGLDTHVYSLLIGSPRPRGGRTPGAATLSALIGSPRPRAAEPQVRQPYQEIIAVLLYGLPFAIGLQTRGQAPGAATLSGDPYFMGLDTHIDAIHGISAIS